MTGLVEELSSSVSDSVSLFVFWNVDSGWPYLLEEWVLACGRGYGETVTH